MLAAIVCVMVLPGCTGKTGEPTASAEITDTDANSVQETTKGAVVSEVNGTFTGTGSGYGGEVTVQVDFKSGQITDFTITSGNETSLLEKRAMPILKERVLAAQSPAVGQMVNMRRAILWCSGRDRYPYDQGRCRSQ